MKQAWLLFWKDVQYLWVELSVYGALLAIFAVAVPQTWLRRDPSQFLNLFVSLLKILLLVSWLVLIARAVHADSLVGQEQFWITRPYRWQSLLGAKALFIAICIGVPFMVMQWALLVQAGLNPFAAKAGMAVSLLKFCLIVVLPFFVVASVTENLAMMFTFVAGMMLIWGAILSLFLSGKDMRMSPPYSLGMFCVMFGGLMIGILIYQYARRRTMHSRLAMVGLLMLFVLMILGYDKGGFGIPIKALIRDHYPASNSLRLVFAGQVPYDERGEDDLYVPRGQVEVKLPVRLEGLFADEKLRDTYLAVEIEGGGVRYAPPWQNAAMSDHAIAFVMPKDVFQRFASVDARMHLELVAEALRPAHIVQSAAAERFTGPMGGVCSLIDGKVYCRYAYQERVSTRAEAKTCAGDVAAAILRRVPTGTMPDPVVNDALSFKGNVCTGDPVRFTEYRATGVVRITLDTNVHKIEQYRAR